METTLSGENARLDHRLTGTRWDSPPCRRSIFDGMSSDTVHFVHGVLDQAQKDEGKDASTLPQKDSFSRTIEKRSGKDSSAGGEEEAPDTRREDTVVTEDVLYEGCSGSCSDGAPKANEHEEPVTTDEADQNKLEPLSPDHVKPKPDIESVRRFADQAAVRRSKRTVLCALQGWRSLTARLQDTRHKINVRFEQRERVRSLYLKRGFLVALRKHSAEKRRAREAAECILKRSRQAAITSVLIALSENMEKGRKLEKLAGQLRDRVGTSEGRRAKCAAFTSFRQACVIAATVRERAQDMRNDHFLRLSVEFFGGWAAATGLAGRLRKRLGRADRSLLKNVICAWAIFSQHSMQKRLRKEERLKQRASRARIRAWDTEILDDTFSAWAIVTAASKFRRLRLSAHILRGWRAVVRAPAADVSTVRVSRANRDATLNAARKEAGVRFARVAQKRLLEIFGAWAVEAGLAARLRLRLGKAEAALLRNALRGWAMFARHSLRKRDARTVGKATQRRNQKILRAVLSSWADATAADKFYRMRLRYRAFRAWRRLV